MNLSDLVSLQESNWPTDYDEKVVSKHGFDPNSYTKFYDHPPQWQAAAQRALKLKLHQTKGLYCLDIGPAAGHFPYLLKLLGHHAETVELPNMRPYWDSLEHLGIPVQAGRIRPYRVLPLSRKYDLITVAGISFDQVSEDAKPVICRTQEEWVATEGKQFPGKGENWVAHLRKTIPQKIVYYWDVPTWMFCIDDLMSNLTPGGRLFLRHNYNIDHTVWLHEQPEFFEALNKHDRIAHWGLKSPELTIQGV